ncbi:MAG: DUF222 domain-containing protein [Micropruina sp.]|uniref:HNH endonuclease n=1 Tax=Micropruina sp. TaxID=2737536 RepID=UPI0039E26835
MDVATRLDAAGLAGWVADLAGLDCADPVEIVAVLRQLERLKNAASAAQARAMAELRAIREAEARSAGRSVRRVASSVAGEVGLARRESPHRANVLVGIAAVLPELPHAAALFAAGELSEWRVTVLMRETAVLSKDDRAAVDAELGPTLADLSTGQIAAEARKAAYRLDPHSVVARIGQAEKDRQVTLRPAPDCMAYLSGLLPAKDGVAVFASLTKAADEARAAGDVRSKGQVMADTLIARVTGQEPAGGIDIEVQVVMTDEALLGDSDTPARLNGYGPIPAGLARSLIAFAAGADRAWIRRLYAPPGEGRLVGMESTARRFPQGMKDFIAARDGVCRTPFCGAPIRHADHVTPVRAGGITSVGNGQGLCEQCNYLKEQPGWSVTAEPDGSIVVRTPTGHAYLSRPPDLPHEPKRRRVRPAGVPFHADLYHRKVA